MSGTWQPKEKQLNFNASILRFSEEYKIENFCIQYKTPKRRSLIKNQIFLMHIPYLKAKYLHLNQFYRSIMVSNNRIYLRYIVS